MTGISDKDVIASLAQLGTANDDRADQDLARFRHRLRRLHDDPAEAARIDALAAEAASQEDKPRQSASPASEDLTSFYRQEYPRAVRFLMTSHRASGNRRSSIGASC
jgi:hypothetical protein